MPGTPPASSDTTTRCPKRRRSARNSLNDMLRQHAGTSLFVRPMCWTDLHSKLLGASFVELPPCNTPVPDKTSGSPPSKGHLQPSKDIVTLSDGLTALLTPVGFSRFSPSYYHSNAVRTVLSTLWPDAFCRSQLAPELPIFYGDRVYREAVRAQVQWIYSRYSAGWTQQSSFKSTWTRPAADEAYDRIRLRHDRPVGKPMMWYVGKRHLAMMRQNLFRVAMGPGDTMNHPVNRLQRLRSKALRPANPDHDALYVAIFLAMAQRHFYGPALPSPRRDSQWFPSGEEGWRPSFEDLRLRILTHDIDTAEFIVYTGHVTTSFLARFYDPFAAPCEEEQQRSGMKIEYARVPIWPILGLRERLGKALGEEIVGPFDASEMERWETTEEVGDKDQGVKRRHDALADVFHGSPNDEETENEEEAPRARVKRRRLPEGSPVGVVV